MENKRKLPEIMIEGTVFLVNAEHYELIQKDNPLGKLSVFDMNYRDNQYHFSYNKRFRSVQSVYDDPSDEVPVSIPALVDLDPEGMALKYGLNRSDLKGKTDYAIMADKQALIDRLNGRLTTIDIAGHTFFVDLPMEMLRPKDDFASNGIRFDDIDEHFNDQTGKYEIPYNKCTHEYVDLDYDNLVEMPKDIILIAFPYIEALDPVGYARKHGWDKEFILEEHPQQTHFVADVLKGKDFWLDERIKENRERLGIKPDQSQRRGRSI